MAANGELAKSEIKELKPHAWLTFDPNLVPIGHYLRADVAYALDMWAYHYWKKFGVPMRLNYGYRDIAEQKRLYALYKAGRGNLAAWPGTSNHGWGIAVDINIVSDAAFNWLKKTAKAHGFYWAGGTFSSIEKWHFEKIRKLLAYMNKIRLHSVGPHVRKVKHKLDNLGYDVDMKHPMRWTNQDMEAAKKWKKRKGIRPVNGVIGKPAYKKLFNL